MTIKTIHRIAGVPRLQFSSGSVTSLSLALLVLIWYASGGLSFLELPTGWQLGFSLFSQESTDPYWWTIGLSVLNTVLMSLAGIVLATLVGTLLAIVMLGRNPIWSRIAKAYVQLFRNLPLLLQALFWLAVINHLPTARQAPHIFGAYISNRGLSIPCLTPGGIADLVLFGAVFALTFLFGIRASGSSRLGCLVLALAAGCVGATLFGVITDIPVLSFPKFEGFDFKGGLTIPSEFLALLAGLSIFGSAYVAEIVRGGFAAVPAGIEEAAEALALPRWAIEVKVRIPIALRTILLPIGSQYTILIKATSIGLAVGFTDLFAVTIMSINQSGQTIPLLAVMTIIFVVLNQTVISAFNFLNEKFEIPGYEKSE